MFISCPVVVLWCLKDCLLRRNVNLAFCLIFLRLLSNLQIQSLVSAWVGVCPELLACYGDSELRVFFFSFCPFSEQKGKRVWSSRQCWSRWASTCSCWCLKCCSVTGSREAATSGSWSSCRSSSFPQCLWQLVFGAFDMTGHWRWDFVYVRRF